MTVPQSPPQPDPHDDQSVDPHFDIRRGLVALVIVMTVMVVITLICVWLAGR